MLNFLLIKLDNLFGTEGVDVYQARDYQVTLNKTSMSQKGRTVCKKEALGYESILTASGSISGSISDGESNLSKQRPDTVQTKSSFTESAMASLQLSSSHTVEITRNGLLVSKIYVKNT